jgi:protein-tyrosine phosphatase
VPRRRAGYCQQVMAAPAESPRRVLVVCTANVCRSPVAERLLQRDWTQAGVAVEVRSAGSRGGRNTVHRYTREAAGFARIDLDDHRSRMLTDGMIQTEGADLVIGMTREHLRVALALDPDCWPRAFTLRELARRTDELSPPPTEWDDWIARCGSDRDRALLHVPDLGDDLPDPYGRPASAHILMVQEVSILAGAITAATAGISDSSNRRDEPI